MHQLRLGTTMVELIIYVSLLGLVGHLIFGLILKMQNKQQNIWERHLQLSNLQIAGTLLSNDLRVSRGLDVKKGLQTILTCNLYNGPVVWKLEKGILWRLDNQSNLRKIARSKVADKIDKLGIQVKKSKSGSSEMVKITLVGAHKELQFQKTVLLRNSLKI